MEKTAKLPQPYNNNLPITAWAEADRPREKLLRQGRKSLSDAELLAILLGSGSRTQTAVGLAQTILSDLKHDLQILGRSTLIELKKFSGIGDAKAITILAALELGRRLQFSSFQERQQVKCSMDAYQILAPMIADLDQEEFWIILLNRASKVLDRVRISQGGTAGTVVDAKLVFTRALSLKASSVILCHNHPSGSLFPSQPDKNLTQKLLQAGKLIDIMVLDHLIIAEHGYYSFADEGLL
ncbi:MAG: DNA repair protein RadC [Saprospiraceae bacterium]|nr:DNA repair protein RadC [Saprospiraceae bacterium]